MHFENTIEFARKLDAGDALARFRNAFFIPRKNKKELIYFCGNSLGLQPRETHHQIEQELFDWAALGVEGHFEAKNPWVSYHEPFGKLLSDVVGAKPKELVAMGSLTANLHLLLVSFYRPKGKRVKIICEQKPFPSDTYALESQIRFHGLDPADVLVELKAKNGNFILEQEEIIEAINSNGPELALVMMGGVNYLSGQAFDIEGITRAAHQAGAMAGFDLAHATGNIPLKLHDWNVDFACWCSYKYLNSGPGGVGGIFIHEKHLGQKDIPRLNGWWGVDPKKKFRMESEFSAAETAEAWQLSNAPVLPLAAHRAALQLFEEAGMERLHQKSKMLTGYLAFVIQEVNREIESRKANLEIITPIDPDKRGCQLSMIAHGSGKDLHDFLNRSGAVTDWRAPNIIRMAPVPLYNTFEDVFQIGQLILSFFRK